MAANAVNLTQTMPPLAEDCPAFSGTGGRIAYDQFDGDQYDILVMNANGSGQSHLTDTPAPVEEYNPDWLSIQRCGGRRITIAGDDGPDRIRGTRRRDVIDANRGRDTIRGRGGNDLICGGGARDRIFGGEGRDRCHGGKGRDRVAGCERGRR
jgi:Ca2+-binding RTX toxin-like protein